MAVGSRFGARGVLGQRPWGLGSVALWSRGVGPQGFLTHHMPAACQPAITCLFMPAACQPAITCLLPAMWPGRRRVGGCVWLAVLLCVCTPVCLPSCLDGWLPSCLDGWLPSCLDGWLPSCLDGWLPTCLDGWLPTCLCACVPMAVPACFLYGPHQAVLDALACLPPHPRSRSSPRCLTAPPTARSDCMPPCLI